MKYFLFALLLLSVAPATNAQTNISKSNSASTTIKGIEQKIKDAVAIHGALSHKTLIDNLPKSISYGEIKMVLAAEKT